MSDKNTPSTDSKKTPDKNESKKTGFMILFVLLLALSIALMAEALIFLVASAVEALRTPQTEILDLKFDLKFIAICVSLFVIMAGIAFGLSLWIAKKRQDWFSATAQMRDASNGGYRKVLIMGISPEEKDSFTLENGKLGADLTQLARINLRWLSANIKTLMEYGFLDANNSSRATKLVMPAVQSEVPDTLVDGTKDNNCSCKWMQNFRALKPHIYGMDTKVEAELFNKKSKIRENGLELIYLVPSEGHAEGAKCLKKLLLAIFDNSLEEGHGIEVKIASHDHVPDPDYTDFIAVRNRLLDVRQDIHKTKGRDGKSYTDKDICIDATAGQKPFSIGAALVTLNHNLVYSYVTTGQRPPSKEGGDPYIYDARIDMSAFVSDA